MRFAFKLNLIFAFVLLLQAAGFAQTNTETGIRLYQDGKYEAVEALKKSAGGDGVAAYYLGLSYEKLGRTNEAVSSYKKSADRAIYQIRGDLVKKYGNLKPKEDIQLGENAPRDNRIKAAYESLSRLKEIDPGKA